MKRIVITGGSGFVGRSLCRQLLEHDARLQLVVPTRRPVAAHDAASRSRIELVDGDLFDAATLARWLTGADALVHLVAILHGEPDDFDRLHVVLPRRLAAACAAAGIKRVVHVSALGVAPQAPSNYLRSKAAGEAVWQQAAQAQGLDLTILRPSVIFGTEDHFTNLFASLLRVLPVLPLAGANARFQPVWVEDVARAAVRCLGSVTRPGPVIECAGPEVVTLAQIVRQVGDMSGHPRQVVALPDALARWQARAMGWLPGQPLMSRDNLLSMQVPNVASGSLPGLAALGIAPAALATLAGHFDPAKAAEAATLRPR